MQVFQDGKGREWSIEINCYALKSIQKHLQADLMELVHEGLEPIFNSPTLLCDILFVLCKDQADKRRVKDDDFGMSLSGDVIKKATDALVEAIIDFFPDEKKREAIRRGMSLREKAETESTAKVIEDFGRMEKMSVEEMETELLRKRREQLRRRALLQEMLKEPSGDAPASSASIPVPSPSGS